MTKPFAPNLDASIFNLSIILSDLLCQVIFSEGSLKANSLDASISAIVSHSLGKSKYIFTSDGDIGSLVSPTII